MKVFVAGKMEDRFEVRLLMNLVKQDGHSITCDWIKLAEEKVGREKYAIENAKGVMDCDVLIAYMVTEYIYRCQFVETGIAIAMGKSVIIIGKMYEDCIFRHHPLVRVVDSIDEAMCILGCILGGVVRNGRTIGIC